MGEKPDTLEARWREAAQVLIVPGMPERAKAFIRSAFYGGAIAYATVLTNNSPDRARCPALDEEMVLYLAEVETDSPATMQ